MNDRDALRFIAEEESSRPAASEAAPPLAEAERERVLYAWNDNRKDYPANVTVVELFERQVARTPEALAVVCGEQRASYAELNERVNQLAHRLRRLGVGPEVLVGVLVERSVEMLVALLGTLKAGGAYVPLDPQYPAERISFMLKDAAVSVVLTQRGLRALLAGCTSEVVELDTEAAALRRERVENPDAVAEACNLAYVIYTSGSTGRPKGVAIEHRSAAALMFWAQETFDREDLAGVLAATSVCFDLSVFELFAPLCWGGTAVVVGSALHLAAAGPAPEVTLINTVPSAMAEVLSAGVPASVRTINLAGEPLKGSLARRIHEQTRARLFNLYGPSEDTTYSTAVEVPRQSTGAPTIGRPLPNTQVYILNEGLEPVPVGEAGELYIGGCGLARGYLSRPALTAERFIPDPYGRRPGARLYRTGDVARYRPDGEIEFLGRVDHQVKIRGFRIELGEVESVLESRDDVKACVVAAREYADGDRRLVAYLIPAGHPAPSTGELRLYLRERLPEYMMPAAFVPVEEFPLTPSGKVDRRALPDPDPARPSLVETFTPPATPAEKKIAAIWADILRREEVGAHDNFFDLGGDSLLATRVGSRMRDAFGLEVPLRSLFEHPTVAALARQVEDRIKAAQELPPAAAAPSEVRGDAQLSFAQQLMWMLHRFEPDSSVYNIPLVIHLDGRLDRGALEESFGEIMRRHEVLRAIFEEVQGKPVERFSPHAPVELQTLSLVHLSEPERSVELQRLTAEELRRPFDLARGPLLRGVLLRLSEERHVLLLSMHHIVSDGWSVDILVSELTALYEAFQRRRPSPLAELPMQYADFARLQRERLRGERLGRLLEYWEGQLSGAVPVLDLPTDRPRPPVQTYRGAVHALELDGATAAALRKLAQGEGATLYMVLLAAFKTLLHRYTGQVDICVGSPIAGRHWAGTEELIGPFLNTLALRTDLSGDPTFPELLRRVREVALGAYEHQDMPFGLLLERLPIQRGLSHTPLFQVLFNMLSYEGRRVGIELPGLTLSSHEILEHGSKFDLTLYVRQGDGGGLSLNMVYNADLFEHAHVVALLGQFRTLLEGIISNPERTLSRLPLVGEDEWGRLAAGKNSVGPNNPFIEFKGDEIEQSIAQRFEQQARKYPRNLAVKTPTHSWTYEELNRRAGRVARALNGGRGAGAERVGLLFKHDAPMVAALLGALKAGRTYVPLDTAYPLDRLSLMVRDSQLGAVLTDGKSLALAHALAGDEVPLIDIDADADAAPNDDAGGRASAESTAYILYTSGSTGEPKGVAQSHRNVLHHIRAYTNALHISAEDRLTLLSSYSFDAAVMDIFGALLNGASLHPIDLREGGFDQLFECMSDDGITIYHSTPTVYRYFAGGLDGADDFPRLRLVVLGGEEVVHTDVELFKERFPAGCLLVNGFGPTESTVTLQYFIDRELKLTRSTVPVGYPVVDTEVLILDEAGQRVPPYVVGEIVIRGEHVALGYWRREELTRKAFAAAGGNKRTYRTGDLGRVLGDGSVEFRGRKDSQAKVRGYRIELGEIEATLRQHPAVCEAAAVVRAAEDGETRLVAYVVPEEGAGPTVSELRAYLKERLPDYMLPSVFMTVEGMALTSNGKLDRRALPEPHHARPELREAYVAPRTPQEEALADIWAQVLQVEQVGAHDNFFELGGDSLSVAQLISRIREAFSVDLSMRTLFEKSTIAEQAELVGATPARRQEE